MNSRFSPQTRNVLAPVLNVLISGVVLFVLYRYLYDRLGIAEIGIWSLVLAAISVSRIGELGLSAGVVRFVAIAIGKDERQRAADIVQTIVITLAVVMGPLMFAAAPLFELALRFLLPQQDVAIALEIVPIALGSLWLMIIVSVFSGSLDGCLRLDLRSMLTAVSQIIYLAFTLLLVPHFGLKGVAWAQLIQYALLLVGLWVALRLEMRELPVIPSRWNFSLLKEVFDYGVRFQVISVFNMLFEPLTKVIMSKFGGLEALGFYEMANRLILQCRAIIIEASRVMVPTVAALGNAPRRQARELFEKAYSINFYVAILLYGLLGIATTSICILWLGHRQDTFILFALVLNVGWFGNTLCGTSYFSNLGAGRLGTNMISHVLTSIISALASVLLAMVWGGTGVVVGVSIGLLGGAIFILVSHFRQLEMHWPSYLIPKGLFIILLAAFLMSFMANFLLDANASLIAASLLAVLLSAALVGVALAHPNRNILTRFKLR